MYLFKEVMLFLKFWLIKFFFFSSNKKYNLKISLDNSYIISSDKGLFVIKDGICKKLFNLPCFGISINNNKIFFSSSDHFYTYIFEYEFEIKNIFKKIKLKVIFKKRIKNFGDRIHQIFLQDQKLFFTATYDDSLYVLNLDDYTIKKLFKLNGKYKINDFHINSVRYYYESVFFIYNNYIDSFNQRRISLIIHLTKKEITKYFVDIPGIHDIHFDGKNIFLSITFGDSKFKDGYILFNNKNLNSHFFKNNKLVPRGIAGNLNELVFGSSNKGNRFIRFDGKSKLIVMKNNKFVSQTFYSSQIYDILRINSPANFQSISNIDDNLHKIAYKIENEKY